MHAGSGPRPKGSRVLAKTLVSATPDKYLTAAVFSSLGPDSIEPCFSAVRQRADHDEVSARQIVELSSMCAALDRGDLVQKLIAGMDSAENGYPTWQIEVAGQWLEAINEPINRRMRLRPSTAKASETATELTQRAQRSLERILQWARKRAADDAVDAKLRSACLRLSIRNAPSRDMAIELAMAAFSPQTSGEVQRVAVQESANLNTPDAGKHLLERWRSLGPSVRQELLSSILPRPVLIEELLSQLENGAIRTAEIDAASRQRLLNNRSDQLRRREAHFRRVGGRRLRRPYAANFKTLPLCRPNSAQARILRAEMCRLPCARRKGNAVGPNLEA